MKVMRIDSNNMRYDTNARVSQKKTPSFKWRISGCDIGASFPGATAKISGTNDKGRELFTFATKLKNDVSGFVDNSEFISKLHDIFIYANKVVQNMDSRLFTSRNDQKQLSGIALFVPGITHRPDVISYIPNLRDKQGNSLKNIDFREYIARLMSNKTDIIVDDASFKFVATKDLNGTVISIAQKIAAKNKLNEGYFISPVLTGGGFGAGDMKIMNGYVDIFTGEPSNYIAPNHNFKAALTQMIRRGDSPEKLLNYINNNTIYSKIGRQGTGVKDYIKAYFRSLGHEELAPLAIKAGDAKIVNYNEMTVKDSKLAEQLLTQSKGFFVLKSDEGGVYTLGVNPSRIAPELMLKAKIEAANAYATGIAEYSIFKINDMFNRVILTGPLASGLDNYIKKYPEMFGTKSLPDLISKKINEIIAETDLPTTKYLMEHLVSPFRVICHKDFNIKDNTGAGWSLLDSRVHITNDRGNSMQIPFNVLNDYKYANAV